MGAEFKIENDVLVKYEGKDTVVVIPDGVTKIGENAFDGNKTLTELTMPNTVTFIGKYAFRKCAKLKSVVFSNALEEIEYDGFIDCKALKAIELPKTLRSLGSGVFAGCSKLTSVKCESDVFEAGSDPFSDFSSTPCTQLADKQGFLIFCGVLYAYYGTATEIAIPEGVKTIIGGTFKSGTYNWEKKLDIKSVEIPASVKEIGNYAFANNKKLKTIKMPSGVKLGTGVFDGCDNLADENGFFVFEGVAYAYFGDNENVVVSEGVKELFTGLFANRKMHTISLPNSLVSIGDSAFSGCALLESIIIPEGVEEIGTAAFKNCEHLTSVSIPQSVKSMGDGVFIGCRGLADDKGFVIANNAIHAFFGADREIIVPEGITSIAGGVFDKTGITSIKLPTTLKKLGSAFTGCNMLTSIDIPEGITKLFRSTFSGCSRLEKVALPSTLIEIDDNAFEGCEKLVEISIPSSVKVIGSGAFRLCSTLPEICIPDGVSVINWRTFTGCTSLHSMHLPDSVRLIEGSAFENCTSLEEVTIPDAVEEIKYSAFENCTNLKKVNYRKIQGTISLSAFKGCERLVDENGLTIIANALWKCEDGKENVVIPEGVSLIAPDAFREGWKGRGRGSQFFKSEGTLKSVVLPTTLKKILNGAFAGCKALKQITIPNGVEVIDEECFINCEALARIELPDSVLRVGKQAFSGCTALQNVKLSTSMTEINAGLFYGCKSLKSITIPSAIDSIGIDAFRGCSSLKAIEVDEGNTSYSSVDGMLYNKTRDTLVFIPGGQKHKEYTIPDRVKTIGRHAFIDCLALQKVVIPATVENVGDEAFPRNEWNSKSKLKDIEVSPKAGSGTVGENVFDIMEWDKPLVYPKLPVTFVKEQTTQVCLGLGYCQNPEKYEGEYANIYRKYAQSHQKTLIKKAQQQKLKAVEQYFTAEPEKQGASTVSGFKPNLSLKKPNELQKVEILEETVIKGTLDDLKDVIRTYKSFEITARALGLAARYRGVAFVRELVNGGATFAYKSDTSLQRKYTMDQKTAAGSYSTEYYLMLVPTKLDLKYHSTYGYYEYDYTPMFGVSHMNIPDELEKNVLPLNDRIEVVKYFAGEKKLGVSLDEMLFWALTRNELDFADALIELGVNLQETPPTYYSSWGPVATYMDTITSGTQSLYWNTYVTELTKLKANQVLPILERLNSLAVVAGKKLVLSQKLFDELNWNDASLAFALENIDFSKVNQKKALEAAVSKNGVASLAKMADAGWLSQTAKREKLIAYARENKKHDALAWLMDFKNRTVDVVAEEAKEEAKMIKELTAKPDSVAAMKKVWSYKKQDDGTLVISSYKGTATEVEIPAMIGKVAVTAIGEDAFSASSWGRKATNYETRKKITSVIVPEGVKEIGDTAFIDCESLVSLQLPSSLKKIGKAAFRSCKNLKTVSLPKGVKSIATNAFWNCDSLKDENGFVVIDGILLGYYGHDTALHIPDGVKSIVTLSCGYSSFNYDPKKNITEVILPDGLESIGESAFEEFKGLASISIPAGVKTISNKAFYKAGLKSVELKEGLETIGAGAFAATPLETVVVPKSVKAIGAQAFYGCSRMRDFFISDHTEKLYKEVFGKYDSDDSSVFGKPSGIYVHTPTGSATEEYVKQYGGIYVVNDYNGSEG